MKKSLGKITLAICAAATVALLASCSGDKKTNSSAGGTTNNAASSANTAVSTGTADSAAGTESSAGFTPVEGKTYDTGMFTVTVPNGWLAVPASDLFDDYEGDYDPTALTLIKDGKEDWDSLDHAYIKITLYDKDALMPSKSFYDDAKDMDPVTVSGFDCNVFSCSSGDYPYIILEGASSKNDISFSILTKNEYSSVNYTDADVQTILNSVAVK